jgi:hypothetical protein
MLSHLVLKTLAGSLRKGVFSGAGLQTGGKARPRPYKPWRLWRAFALGLGVAILAQANYWLEIYRNFQTLSVFAAANDLIGRLDWLPIIFVLVAAARNGIMKRRRARA